MGLTGLTEIPTKLEITKRLRSKVVPRSDKAEGVSYSKAACNRKIKQSRQKRT